MTASSLGSQAAMGGGTASVWTRMFTQVLRIVMLRNLIRNFKLNVLFGCEIEKNQRLFEDVFNIQLIFSFIHSIYFNVNLLGYLHIYCWLSCASGDCYLVGKTFLFLFMSLWRSWNTSN